MMALLADLLSYSQATLWAGFLIFLRVGAMVSLLPGIGETALPVRVRLVLALALSALLLPTVTPPSLAQSANVLSLCAGEMVIGVILGLSIRLIAHGLLIAGVVISQTTSLAQLFGSVMADGPQPAVGLFLYWAGLGFFMMSGMPVLIVIRLADTFHSVPPGAVLTTEWSAAWIIDAVSRAFALGFTLAAPFVIAALLYNLAMGVINKAMPQLMVAFVGAPAITGAAILLLLVATPFMLTVWLDALQTHGLAPFRVIP